MTRLSFPGMGTRGKGSMEREVSRSRRCFPRESPERKTTTTTQEWTFAETTAMISRTMVLRMHCCRVCERPRRSFERGRVLRQAYIFVERCIHLKDLRKKGVRAYVRGGCVLHVRFGIFMSIKTLPIRMRIPFGGCFSAVRLLRPTRL